VSVIPEALPLETTFSLARSAKRLAKRKVIVKRLSAIEDLGGIEILCCDKTGTLTENMLTIVNTYSDNNEQTIWLANLASSFELKKKIEPFDIALDKGLNSEQKKKITKVVKISEESFDPKTRKNSVLVKDGDKTFLIIRGATEAVVSSCSDLDKKTKDNIDDWTSREGKQGHRVLAIIYKEINVTEKNSEFYNKELEKNDFTFSGIISFVDPIKKSSFSAVKQAKNLGVKIIIITGDSPEVAGAVANEIGLIDSLGKVITGEKWQTASQKTREKYLEIYSVFARVSPEEKFAIIEALRKRYMIGFLGEGINDAPALKIAGVSLVVDSAADIAREAADIILLKKNLDVIIDGIKEGRQVFANTTKYIKSTLASNFGNFFAVAIASLMIDFLPMLPIQILLVNLLSDAPMISISTDTVEASELKSPKKYQTKEIIIIAIILGLVSTVFDFIFFDLFYRISPEVLQTNWFIGSVLTELVLLFSIRTKSLFIKSLRPSKSIIWLSLMTFILTIGLPFTVFGQKVFKFVAPTPSHLMLILSLVIIYFIISEIVKLLYYKTKQKNKWSMLEK
jgi:Mg2+-importing ATPase